MSLTELGDGTLLWELHVSPILRTGWANLFQLNLSSQIRMRQSEVLIGAGTSHDGEGARVPSSSVCSSTMLREGMPGDERWATSGMNMVAGQPQATCGIVLGGGAWRALDYLRSPSSPVSVCRHG